MLIKSIMWDTNNDNEHLHVGVRRITGNLVNRAHKTTLF